MDPISPSLDKPLNPFPPNLTTAAKQRFLGMKRKDNQKTRRGRTPESSSYNTKKASKKKKTKQEAMHEFQISQLST